MGLNYVRRPVREQFDVPNDFIANAMARDDYRFAHMDQHVILEFMDTQLDKVDVARIALSNKLLRGQ